MGNQQMTNQQLQQPQQKQQKQQKQKRSPDHDSQKRRWLAGKKKAKVLANQAPDSKSEVPATSNGKSNGCHGNNNANSLPLPLTAITTTVDVAPAVDMSPSPVDSANRTWSEADTTAGTGAAPSQLLLPTSSSTEPVTSEPGDKEPAEDSRRRQRDSGISQLSTEEFERVFDELASRSDSFWHSTPAAQPLVLTQPEVRQEEQLLAPRLRVKRSPTFQQKRAASSADLPEVFMRPEDLLMMSASQRRSACSVINDDHMFPDAVTPTKVDSGLLDDYDVPYMDDDTFFVYDDWYMTDDKRWSYLRRSEVPQLADWGDCRLTESVSNSAKPTPHHTPAKLFGGRKALFGLCFGAKSRA